MSTIDSLFGNTAANQINPSALANQGIIGAADNDNDGNFGAAIAQALAQIGAVPATIAATDPNTTASSTTATSTTAASATQAQQDLQAFLQDLLNNLQSQNTNSASNSSISDATGTHHHHHHGDINGLDSLIQQIDASSATTSNSLTGSTTTSNSASISTLQQDFQNLLSSVGNSGNQVSLSDFLKTVSNNLHTTQASTSTATV